MLKLFALTILLLLVVSPAHAYLDPGTGSMLIQGVIAALAIASAAVAAFWTRLRNLFPARRPAETENRDAPLS